MTKSNSSAIADVFNHSDFKTDKTVSYTSNSVAKIHLPHPTINSLCLSNSVLLGRHCDGNVICLFHLLPCLQYDLHEALEAHQA